MSGGVSQQNVRTLLLIVCCLSYLLVGAAIFSALEYEDDQRKIDKLKNIQKWIIRKYNISNEDLAHWTHYLRYKQNIDAKLYQWSFAGSVYFATTVVTTIDKVLYGDFLGFSIFLAMRNAGYGRTVPQTQRGKIFCIIYASIGIPLALTMLQSLGERLITFIAFVFKRVRQSLGMKKTEVSLTNMMILCSMMLVITMGLGALIFAHHESWNYFDSLYFSFVTLTTIGFGDMVALQESIKFNSSYVAMSLLFIFLGLIFESSVLNLMVMRLLQVQNKEPPPEHLVHGGPRCNNCNTANFNENFEPLGLDYSNVILRNFEEEITFTTYKALNRKRASI